MRSKLYILISLLILVNVSSIHAQNPPPIVLACVMPTNPQDGESYVIALRNSTLFGLILPISADVTIFGNQGLNIILQRITTDAPTGGYRLGLEVARLKSDMNLLNNGDCAQDIAQLSKALNISVDQNTLRVPVSSEYGLTVQVGGGDKLTSSYLGVFGFQLQSTSDSHPTNFQIAQISRSEPKIDISLSKVSAAAPAVFTIIGNKDFGLSKSGPANPDSFGAIAQPDAFQYLKDQYKNDMPALFETMRVAGMPIYPQNILGYFSPQSFNGGYLSLRLGSDEAKRVPEFTPGVKVSVAAEGVEARLFLASRPKDVFGKLAGKNTLSVVRVDDHGQLIIRTQEGQEAIIEAWRVEAEQPQ